MRNPLAIAPDEQIELPYNQLMFKSSHNSYERAEPMLDQLTWDPNKNYQGGCRQLELDIWRHSNQTVDFWKVGHTNGGNISLSFYLQQIANWHTLQPNHDFISIVLDIKSTDGVYSNLVNEIDNYIGRYFLDKVPAENLFTPGKILQPGTDLVSSLRAKGWPTLCNLTGNFMFVLSGYEKWKSFYADQTTNTTLCFADKEELDNDSSIRPPLAGTRIFYNFHIFNDHYDIWKNTIPRYRQQGFITRGFLVNDKSLWKKAMEAGVNAISTDKIKNHEWAVVGSSPFVQVPTSILLYASFSEEAVVVL